ncbi:MAG TPA: asparaginase [Streptosporangiaceae bacterium]
MSGADGTAHPVNPVLVEVERSGFVESLHRGAAVGLDARGGYAVRAGVTDVPIFPRSANKPLQAAAMLRHGLGLDGELLALAAASHSGEDFHVDGVRSILAGAGLTPEALRCPVQPPLDQRAADALVAAGERPSRVHMNCSGKHAAMLATCAANGWPTESYTSPDHPLQVEIRRTIEELAGEKVAATGVDGCGAPLFGFSLIGVATAFRALLGAEPGSPERRVADAMRAHPEWTSGTDRDERRLMDAVPGLLVKSGAEAVDAFAFAAGSDVLAGAVKIEDGGRRARTPVTVALLRALLRRVDGGHGVPEDLVTVPVRGGGRVVGAVRVVPGLFG